MVSRKPVGGEEALGGKPGGKEAPKLSPADPLSRECRPKPTQHSPVGQTA